MIVDLPLPVGPTMPDKLTGLDAEADVAQHGRFVVAESDVIEDDFATYGFWDRGVRPLRNDLIGLEDRLDPVDCDRGLRDGVGPLGEFLHGLEKPRQIGEEYCQDAGGHDAREHEIRASPQH